MARFAGQVAVVAGGSGTVGAGIVRQFLQEGATVVAPVRSAEGRARLLADVKGVPEDKLDVVELEASTEAGAQQLAEHVRSKYDAVDHLVSSLGSWWQKGHLIQQSLEEFSKQVHNLAGSHFVFAKALLPLLKADPASSYTIISGGAGGFYFPDAGMVTIGAATLFGVSIVLRGEYAQAPQRINELRISVPISRDNEPVHAATGRPGAHSHRKVGRAVADLAASKTKGQVVPLGDKELQALQ